MPIGVLRFRLYVDLLKPRQLALLMVTMYGAYFAGSGGLGWDLVLLSVAGLASIGGATALNMYLEADIDSVMSRTRRRPLPSGSVSRGEALALSVALMALGSLAASAINEYVLFSVALGYYSYIIAYTVLSKRRDSLAALVLGSVAGSSPVLGGWAAATGYIGVEAVMLASIVFAWQPAHVAMLNYRFREDYLRAGVPVVPLSETPRRLYYTIAAASTALMAIMWAYAYVEGTGYVAALATTLAAYKTLHTLSGSKSDPRALLSAFKGLSVMVAIPFILLPLEAGLGGIWLVIEASISP